MGVTSVRRAFRNPGSTRSCHGGVTGVLYERASLVSHEGGPLHPGSG